MDPVTTLAMASIYVVSLLIALATGVGAFFWVPVAGGLAYWQQSSG